ncbi:Predicted secreted protein [uncultured Clostridium sp.]|uniref:DUF1002 domain-containing protein n=1 Tax=Muricoprocola aceti TaxID=2981772 RepID=A0ABT2SKJ9_9FIRM|nr:DUF1002 domain-containing protein [Muricoprocola aceti]MCU6725024.1 DUF1002 domain-containing protein [Muricoprocola aceti]SCH36060.1 Predicted secreted protein [uncultured Clostridium sp.]
MKKRILSSIALVLALTIGCAVPAMADSRRVVTLGADLTQDQQNTMMKYFGVSADTVDIIYINNNDEREHLGSYVPLEQIGTKTFSCALVAPTTKGGIQVKTANLSWVTCNMIASTLSTSGVTNCQVVAASPFEVSGTGALTGVIMAYETASDVTLDEEKKDLANEELVTTGNLADAVGQSKATAVINETKLQVIENNVTDIGEINNIVNNVSNNYDVTMSQDQSDEIAALMQKIAQQDYDITQLKATLERVQANVAGDAGASEEQQAEAEKKAQEAEAAAEEQTQESEAAQDNADITIDGAQDQTENILDNTDISALDPNSTNASESTTTQTVLEQTEAETEGDNGTGIPEATGDGTVTSEAAETEAITEAATEAGAETESTIKAEDLDPEKKAIYDEVKSNLDQAYTEKQVTGDDGTVVYLTEEAAKKLPEAVEKYLLKVLAEGADKVAQEEALDTEIPQNIVEETQDLAEDKHYEEADLVQMDKYVRRLVLKDSEKILEDSQLENNDAVVVYRSIMVILEAGFGVEQPDLESEAAVSEDTAQEAPAEEQNEDGTEDEFADFQEETGNF